MVSKPFKIRQQRAPSKNIQIAVNLKITEKQHASLIEEIKKRLEFGNSIRQTLTDRFEIIDKALAGYIILTKEDKAREQDNKQGKGPKPVDMNLQLTDAQIDEGVTYLLSVMAPDTGIYNAIAPADQQDIAQGFARLLNKQGELFGHYDAYNKGFRDMLVYNMGGFIVEWIERMGNVIENTTDGRFAINEKIVAAGNEITPIDPYNLLWDISVSLLKLSKKGEFFATVDVISKFDLDKKTANEFFFNTEKVRASPGIELSYYRIKPAVRSDYAGNTGKPNWYSFLSAGSHPDVGTGFEYVVMYTWIKPKDFGLSDVETMQIWKLHIINNAHIVRAEFLDNAHGMLPISMATPIVDGFDLQTKSYSERLLPLQAFASFQLNIHQRGSRKALYGLTIYDRQVIPLGEEDDLTGGQIAANPVGQDRDLRKSIITINDSPDTKGTMDDIARVHDIAQRLMPTDIQTQVASLERATQYQAAAVVQGSSRRNHKNSKVINNQCMFGVREILMMNVLQFQESITIMDENGASIDIDPSKFRDTELEFVISDGLKGTDRLLVVESLKEIINSILQSQQLNTKIDIVKIIDYWMGLLGDTTDFTQFKFKTPWDALPEDQKQIAFDLLQKAVEMQQSEQGAPA